MPIKNLLTAKAVKEDKMEGFNAGADDYLLGFSFEIDELIARMECYFAQNKKKGVNHAAPKLLKSVNITSMLNLDIDIG
ncbi:MAG: hypothetical protein IPK03_10590 [Bacteroidetes bacterium]|nr:hypothetical protein [Bacteroidota bacterium]